LRASSAVAASATVVKGRVNVVVAIDGKARRDKESAVRLNMTAGGGENLSGMCE
jgi:hypothetical protein